MNINIMDHFSELEDPRLERRKLHSLDEILFLILSCTLCRITDYVHMEDFGKAHQVWFKKYFAYVKGIPSHDTLGRVMSMLSPKALQNLTSHQWDVFMDLSYAIIYTRGEFIALKLTERAMWTIEFLYLN